MASPASTATLRCTASTDEKRIATQKSPGAAWTSGDWSGPRAKANSTSTITPNGAIWARATRERASMRRSLPPTSNASRHPLNARRPLQPFLTILDAGDAGHDRLLLLGPSRKVFRVLREVDRWQALRVGPRGLSPEAAAELVSGFGSERIVVASGAGRGGADLLALPKLAQELEERGLAGAVARRVLRENAAAFLRVTL